MKFSLEPIARFIQSYKKIVLLIATITLLIILVILLISSLWETHNALFSFPSIGRIYVVNVEVYGGNITYINGKPTLDWGIVFPGSKVNRTFNVTSKSNVDGTLIIKAENWTFNGAQNPTYDPSWMKIVEPSCNMTTLKPEQTIQVTLTLDVSGSREFVSWILENNVQNFSFDISVILKP